MAVGTSPTFGCKCNLHGVHQWYIQHFFDKQVLTRVAPVNDGFQAANCVRTPPVRQEFVLKRLQASREENLPFHSRQQTGKESQVAENVLGAMQDVLDFALQAISQDGFDHKDCDQRRGNAPISPDYSADDCKDGENKT